MPSEGTATDISAEDAAGLLHKLITESTRLQAVLRNANGLSAATPGTLAAASLTQFLVKSGDAPEAAFVLFDPTKAVRFRYAAGKAIPDASLLPGIRVTSALSLIYPDSSQIMLLELA